MATRLIVLFLSVICTLSGLYFAVTDFWIASTNPSLIRLASEWAPANPDAWRRMAQVEPDKAVEHWRRVLQLNEGDTEAQLALAHSAEANGRKAEAEQLFLQAAQYNKGYLPAWSLANFYLRTAREDQFWRWARRAASFEVDLTALFDLCLRLKPDPVAVAAELQPRRAPALVQLLAAASTRGLLAEALPVARRTAELRAAGAGAQLLWSADRLLDTDNVPAAREYWTLAGKTGALPYAAGPAPALANGNFRAASLERGFDWRPGSAEVSLTYSEGLQINLYGKQDDTATILRQIVLVEPGHTYELRFRYRASLADASHPVRWRLGQAESEPLTTGDWREAKWAFTADEGARELQLLSRREAGTRRAPGEIEFDWVRLERAPENSGDQRPARTISTFMGAAPKKPTSKL